MKKKITWIQKPDYHRLDSVWYGGKMVEIDTERYVLSIEALGEVRVVVDGEEFVDKNETGRVGYELMSAGIDTDEKLAKAERDGRIEWLNNNWFELVVYDKKLDEYVEYDDSVTDCSPYDNFCWVDAVLADLKDSRK